MDTSTPPSPPPLSSQPTPKRKRDSIPPASPTSPPSMRLNTNIPGAVVITSDEGVTGSPRTKVAYNFQGLQLEDGGAVSKLDLRKLKEPKPEPPDELRENAVRKRVRTLGNTGGRVAEGVKEIPETPATKSFQIVIGPERTVDPLLAEKAGKVVLHNQIDPVIFKGTAVGKKASVLRTVSSGKSRLVESESQPRRKRIGTPPLFGPADASLEMNDGHLESRVVDPDRAALTWHHDEITGHSPDDPEDDGEGINGIGFRPTPAMAYARMEKRRIQLADYRNREAREARAKRSERRRGIETKATSDEEETARRVRFLEIEERNVISSL